MFVASRCSLWVDCWPYHFVLSVLLRSETRLHYPRITYTPNVITAKAMFVLMQPDWFNYTTLKHLKWLLLSTLSGEDIFRMESGQRSFSAGFNGAVQSLAKLYRDWVIVSYTSRKRLFTSGAEKNESWVEFTNDGNVLWYVGRDNWCSNVRWPR